MKLLSEHKHLKNIGVFREPELSSKLQFETPIEDVPTGIVQEISPRIAANGFINSASILFMVFFRHYLLQLESTAKRNSKISTQYFCSGEFIFLVIPDLVDIVK